MPPEWLNLLISAHRALLPSQYPIAFHPQAVVYQTTLLTQTLSHILPYSSQSHMTTTMSPLPQTLSNGPVFTSLFLDISKDSTDKKSSWNKKRAGVLTKLGI